MEALLIFEFLIIGPSSRSFVGGNECIALKVLQYCDKLFREQLLSEVIAEANFTPTLEKK